VPLLSIDEIEEIQEIEEMQNAEAAAAHHRAAAPKPVEREEALAGKVHSGSLKSGALLALVLIACLGVFGVHGASPAAATTPAAAPGTPGLILSGAETNGTVQLTAKVTDPSGAPLTSGKVTFALSSSVFGPRQVPLGVGTLDKTGAAHLTLDGKHSNGYRPTTTGPQEYTASFAANVGDNPVRYSTNVDVTVAKSAFTPAPPKALDGAGRALIKALALIVLTVWLLLITQVLRVVRTCRRVPKAAISSA
jgi:hypothetical protein